MASKKSFHPQCFGWSFATVPALTSSGPIFTTAASTSTGQSYYANSFSSRIVSAHLVDTHGLCCPYCSANRVEEFTVDIPIHRVSHLGQVNVAVQEFEIRKLKFGATLSDHGMYVVGIQSGSTIAFQDTLRLFDRIIHVAIPRDLPHGKQPPPADEMLARLQFLYHETSLPSIRLIVRRWPRNSYPFENWSVVPCDSYDDEAAQFLKKVDKFVRASTPLQHVEAVPKQNLATFGFHPLCFDGETSFARNITGLSHAKNNLNRDDVAGLVRLAIEQANL